MTTGVRMRGDASKNKMRKQKYSLIFIAGAPGTGKSSVALVLHNKLKTPIFEFGWIPEFRQKGNTEISYKEEEKIAFENLTLVLKNYVKHGFKNIIVTDLEDKRILQIEKVFRKENYILVTLLVEDEDVLKKRIMNTSRSSGYRDWKEGIEINKKILKRKLIKNEIRINAGYNSVGKIVREILNKI